MVGDRDGEKGDAVRARWRRRRIADAEAAGVLAGPGYLYRPREVLVLERDEDAVAGLLREAGGEQDPANEELARAGLPVRRWLVDPAVDVPGLLRAARSVEVDGPPPQVAANTVLTGEPPYHGGPGGPPRRVAPRDLVRKAEATRSAGLAVLDTGWARDTPDLHAALMDLLRADPDDVDLLDVDGRKGLDTEAGHGTFICGLVQQVLPGLRIDVQCVLDPMGWGDDVGVALGLLQQDAPVLNLSLGGHTDEDRPPLALQEALRRLGRDRVVVAAAGNDGSSRPFWPAAFKHVVAVAAVDTTRGEPVAAPFSNSGPWVDVCAPGVDLVSTFVRGWQDAGAGPQDFEGWACWSGTSFATPLVAALVAKAVQEGAAPRAAAAALVAGATPLPGLEDLGGYVDPGVDLVCREH